MNTLESTTIDTYKSYELILLDMGDKRDRPYLKMVNPSIGVTHIEGVPKGTKTVKEAICFRNGLKEFEEPRELS